DFDLMLDQSVDNEAVITGCNCGFYARIDPMNGVGGQGSDVGVRYEVDFMNVGKLFVDHPSAHLQWDPVSYGRKLGVTEARMRVPRMLPAEFLEFCLRHFMRD